MGIPGAYWGLKIKSQLHKVPKDDTHRSNSRSGKTLNQYAAGNMKPRRPTRNSQKGRGEQATIPISLSHEPLVRRNKLTRVHQNQLMKSDSKLLVTSFPPNEATEPRNGIPLANSIGYLHHRVQ